MAKVMKGGKEKEGKMTEEQSREREGQNTGRGRPGEKEQRSTETHGCQKILAFQILSLLCSSNFAYACIP